MNTRDVLELLHEIERGERKFAIKPVPVTLGINLYTLETGETLFIYCDEGNEWDYVERISFPDGTDLLFWLHPENKGNARWKDIQDYHPSPEACREIYGMEPCQRGTIA